MSVYFHIAAESVEEFEALESEGAPEVNCSNGAGMLIAEWLTGEPHAEVYAGSLDPAEVLGAFPAVIHIAMEWDADHEPKVRLGENGAEWNYLYMTQKVEGVREVLEAAQRIGRKVTWG